MNDIFTTVRKKIPNEKADLSIEGVEIYFTNKKEGVKLLFALFVHGVSGNADSLLFVAECIAEYCIGCYGGIPGTDLYRSHYTSRLSEPDSVLAYVKTLDYVYTYRIFLVSESYGGLGASLSAARHGGKSAEFALVSTGLSDSMLELGDAQGYMTQYDTKDACALVKEYSCVVIVMCETQDQAFGNGRAQAALYTERDKEARAEFYELKAGHGFCAYTQESRERAYDLLTKLIFAQ